MPEWTFVFQVGQEQEVHVEVGRGEFSILWLDKNTGVIHITDGQGEGWSHLNQSLCQFIRCLDAYKQHFVDHKRSHDPTDEECETLASEVREALLAIDPTVFQDEEGLWSQAIEEIELGVI